jgi:deoxyribonuclease IV
VQGLIIAHREIYKETNKELNNLLFGSHVSIRNGYLGAAKMTNAMKARAFQYFPKNPRSLSVKDYDKNDATACKVYCKENGIVSIAHTPYPTNLSCEKEMVEMTKASLLNDLEIANACGSIGVVVHFGNFRGSDLLEGYKRMVYMLNQVLDDWNNKCHILLENNAGTKGGMGTTFEELVKIRSLTHSPEKIGFCFDTCHAFGSNLWKAGKWEKTLKKGEELGYFNYLKAIHLNNSKYPNGSFKDRHANLTKGKISIDELKGFITSRNIKTVPMILETPDDEGITHLEEISFLNNNFNNS